VDAHGSDSMMSRWERVLGAFCRRAAAAAPLLIAVSAYGLSGRVNLALSAAGPQSEQSIADARQTFESRCAGCHGIDGRGGERAPDIATAPKVQSRSDPELTQVVTNGIPAAGMPAFSTLDAPTVRALIKYVRFLQGKAGSAALPGDPGNGKTLFFGRARCSECHLAGGEGGFIAPDLSSYGRQRPPEEIREAILKPSQQSNAARGTVSIATRTGQTLDGVLRNEDNFSLQLQSLDGTFHLIMKSDVASMTRDSKSLMPADYGSTLNARELNDLISFLMSVAPQNKLGSDLKKKAEPDDEEE
jgi:cytochrome c oxidase cbb3-type subunit III